MQKRLATASVLAASLLLGGWTLCSAGEPADRADMPRTVVLRSPLTTIVRARSNRVAGLGRIGAVVVIPDDAPADLGIGAFAAEHDGTWYQRLRPGTLTPGRHELTFSLGPTAAVQNVPQRGDWSALVADNTRRAGIFFWSASGARCRIRIENLAVSAAPDRRPSPGTRHLADLVLDGYATDAGCCRVATGSRWRLRFSTIPAPDNPFDPAEFAADLVVTRPDGAEERVPAFYVKPHRFSDGGDREAAAVVEPGRFEARYRPRLPGRHRLRLACRWRQGDAAFPHLDDGQTTEADERTFPLPDLLASGEAWDDYVRVDGRDPRFFSRDAGGGTSFYWPIGLNVRSVNDPRGNQRTGSELTPARGQLAYRAYLRRLAAAGGNAVEIWMSSWNLALEWRDDWPGFYGVDRYNLANADRLDGILDLCRRLGIRVNLVVHNHGMASNRCDREWHNNPHNRELGGALDHPHEFFTDPRALRSQDRLRRYLVGRFADHPNVMGWKLWTEINLTAGRGEAVVDWHRQACRRWHELDVYDHGCTTHWSGDYRTPDRRVVFLPELDYVCIDAYHGPERLLAQLLWDSTNDPRHGLASTEHPLNVERRLKPILVTEFGGNWNAAPTAQLLAEHQVGAWVALVSGHAGAPMLWWFEWVDQNDLWAPYRAIAAFVAGEDLRSTSDSPGRAVRLSAHPTTLWSGAWARPGRILGYCQDRDWSYDGRTARLLTDARIGISRKSVAGGPLGVEWWDPDSGRVLESGTFTHAGGPLELTVPAFRRHVAFKLWRLEDPDPRLTAGSAE